MIRISVCIPPENTYNRTGSENANGVINIERKDQYFLRLRTELLDCDLYRFLKNDPEAVNAYRGEYLEEYPWAVFNSDAFLSR